MAARLKRRQALRAAGFERADLCGQPGTSAARPGFIRSIQGHGGPRYLRLVAAMTAKALRGDAPRAGPGLAGLARSPQWAPLTGPVATIEPIAAISSPFAATPNSRFHGEQVVVTCPRPNDPISPTHPCVLVAHP